MLSCLQKCMYVFEFLGLLFKVRKQSGGLNYGNFKHNGIILCSTGPPGLPLQLYFKQCIMQKQTTHILKPYAYFPSSCLLGAF